MSERAEYEIVPRPKPFKSSPGARWPVDAILATVDSGDAVKIPHDLQPSGGGKKRTTPRARLLNLIRDGLKRRGYGLEWAADGDNAVIVWAHRLDTRP